MAAHPQQQQQTAIVEHGREPCPDRILDDIGGAFGMGAIGGGMWHTYKGLRNSPRGYKMIGTLEVGLVQGLCSRKRLCAQRAQQTSPSPCAVGGRGHKAPHSCIPSTAAQCGASDGRLCARRPSGGRRPGWAAASPTGA
jgi:hypothetical protein